MERSLIGRTVGTYHLIDRLGAGGMASVYRAYAEKMDRYVAVKILPIHLAANDTLRQRFEREAQMAARLTHPHILPIYDFGEQDDMPYIVLKLVEGGTLDSFIHEGPLGFTLIARVIHEVAGALDYAHSQGVIHRDLKPENILFDVNGTTYLADFGIARIIEGSDNLTGGGGFIGTAAYASPEQCRGEELAPASDIYSFGVVLYEMLTGHLPYEGSTSLAIIHKQISEPAPNPLKYRPDLPIGITEVLRKALAKMPSVRYQTASALSAALNETLRRELGTQPFTQSVPPPGPNPVFDRPPSAYASPPPMPEELVREMSPTQPARLRTATLRQIPPAAPEAAALAAAPPDAAPPRPDDHATLTMILTVLVVLMALGVILAAVLTR